MVIIMLNKSYFKGYLFRNLIFVFVIVKPVTLLVQLIDHKLTTINSEMAFIK